MRRLTRVSLICLLIITFQPGTAGAEESPDTILCQDAKPGAVLPIPEPFDRWVVILCTDVGQVLAPEVGTIGILWVKHKTLEPFALGVLPPFMPLDKRAELIEGIGADQVRFAKFTGLELTGNPYEDSKQMFLTAFEGVDPDKFDAVYQLNATSIYYALNYRLFFFTKQQVPQHLIICIYRCQDAHAIDVLTFDEAEERIRAFEQEKQ